MKRTPGREKRNERLQASIPMFNPTTGPKTGQHLRAALANPPAVKKLVVDELLYRRKVTLLAANPSTGKSTLATQIALSVTSGTPVFGVLEVTDPGLVYYIPFETDWDEFVQGCTRARPSLPFDENKLVFDDALLGLDICTRLQPDPIFTRIKAHNPVLVIIDPLYLIVAGDLAEGKVAAAAMKWLLALALYCNCAVLICHHTHRERYNARGKRIDEDDNAYGSRWIQANVVVQYNIASESGGTKWTLKKDRYRLSRGELQLNYDPETGLSSALKSKTTIRDELLKFIQWHKPGSELTYPFLAEALECAEGYLAHLLVRPEFRRLIRKDALPGRSVKLVRLWCEEIDAPKGIPRPNAAPPTQPTQPQPTI